MEVGKNSTSSFIDQVSVASYLKIRECKQIEMAENTLEKKRLGFIKKLEVLSFS